MCQQLLACTRLTQQQHRARRLCGAPSLTLHFDRSRTQADETGEGVFGLALASLAQALCRQFAARVVQITLQQRKLFDQWLQRCLGMVKQHNTQGSNDLAGRVAQWDAADHKSAGAVGEQIDKNRLAGFQHLVHLRVLHDARDRMADKVFLALEAQRRQETLVLFVDPDHPGRAVHQHHALTGIGKQIEHGTRRQLQNALGVTRQGVHFVHAHILPRHAVGAVT